MAGRLYARAHSGYLMTEARHIQAKVDLLHGGISDCDDFDQMSRKEDLMDGGLVMCSICYV